MPPPKSNPLHIYRACLRECTYLPLPQCRAYMREFTIQKFRKFIPRKTPGQVKENASHRHLPPEKVHRLLRLARKYASVLNHANRGHVRQLEKVIRMSYGRMGPRKYDLLAKFLYPNGEADFERRIGSSILKRRGEIGNFDDVAEMSKDDEANNEDSEDKTEKHTFYPSLAPTVSTTTTFKTFYNAADVYKPYVEDNPPFWKRDLQPRLQALLHSQSRAQFPFYRRRGACTRVKLNFRAPLKNIWGKPLPLSRYKNQWIKWYTHNIGAALPPLETEKEYWALHDLVTGKRKMPAFIPRRTPPEPSEEEMQQQYFEKQSELILEGPKVKGFRVHRRNITERSLQRLLSQAVLCQIPLTRPAPPGTETEANSGLLFYWDDGITLAQSDSLAKVIQTPLSNGQTELLFA